MLPDERQKIQQMIEDNGGIYSVHLDKDECTHLVAKESCGEKYIYAKNWNTVHIVTMEWIEQCTIQKSKMIMLISIL